MDISLFSDLLRYLLHTEVRCLDPADAVCRQFSEQYCLVPPLQPYFQPDTLARLCTSMDPQILYDTRDTLGVCSLFFRFDDGAFLVGPFVREGFSVTHIRPLLSSAGLSASSEQAIRVYRSQFPLLHLSQVRETVTAVCRAFGVGSAEYGICPLRKDDSSVQLPRIRFSESPDESAILQSYEHERRFLRHVAMGDTENVLSALADMTMNDSIQTSYVNAIYQDPAISLSMLRAMARQAARQGGASPVRIHEITQQAVQRMGTARNAEELFICTSDMVLALTEAVQEARLDAARYSDPIRQAAGYLERHYGEPVSTSALADIAGLSEDYFARCFRKETGVSVSRYVARLRCEKAAELLTYTDLSISEIGSYVGYLDNNYFVKVFRREYDMTPGEYRRNQTAP